MPVVLPPRIARRTFLKSSVAALGAATVARVESFAADPVQTTLHLALLSDTHIPADTNNEYRGFKPAANLDTIIPKVLDARPEGVIINGDAARLTGEVNDYHQLLRQLEPLRQTTPIYIGLGNHDNRDNFQSVVQNRPGERQQVRGKHVVAWEHPLVRIVILDSLLYVDKVAGLLGEAQRQWLTGYLRGGDRRPVVLFIHHTLGDGDGDLLDTDRLFQLIQPFSNVKAIFYGHSHRYEYSVRDGVTLINLPAVGYNFSDDQPVGWVDAVFDVNQVDLTLHAIGGNLEEDGKTRTLQWR